MELRGIPKLDASNNLYYDGDGYAPDGTVTRKYGIITYNGTEVSWAASSGEDKAFYATFNGYKIIPSGQPTTAIGDTFIFDGFNAGIATLISHGRGQFAFRRDQNTIQLYPYDSSIDTTDKLNAYLQSHPLTVVYELATPTTESADPYQDTQICNDFGTEEFIDSRTVPMPVGYNAFYQNNLRAKLEMAPDSPDGDGDYIVRQTDGLNEYVLLEKELPSAPAEDGTYSLKCTVASGTATLSWVSDT